jgi:hypothetical protein
VVVGVLVYVGAAALMTSGALGTEVQERSVTQISTSGSLIAGGRPEWAASLALFEMRPQGYGIGVVPSWTDLQTGRAGMASINVDAGGYTTNFMFGGAFELHSVVSDLWVNCGAVGFALAMLVLFCLVRNASFLLASREAATIVLFTTGVALWAVLFGPLYTDWRLVCVSLGLSMLTIEQRCRHPVENSPT